MLGLLHRAELVARANPRRRSEFSRTETLDSDIAALAKAGDSDQPVTDVKAPAASGNPTTL